MSATTDPPRPVGATRTAAALTARTGWPVRARDIPRLVAQGHLNPAGLYEGHTLYDRAECAAVPEQAVAALAGTRGNAAPGPAIEAFAEQLGRRHGLDVSLTYRPQSGRWHLDWPVRADGRPDPAALRNDLAAHPAGEHRRLVDMATPAHRAIAAARRALAPDEALLVDVETTGLGPTAAIVEIAVVEADTGRTVLDTLVNPDGVPVEKGAQQVHGITPGELDGAPTWPEIWPRLAQGVGSRLLIAYNADFDKSRIRHACRRYGLPVPRWDWDCAMAWRGAAARTSRPGPLNGGHRALGDARAAREVVLAVAGTAYTPSR
ncbi:3'-5' exonuclease [Nocardiopsis sp. NPDC006198]|uniref:3'-5' exonuclease n=1 Tax=Nocardiopsis sp. NPDC006198 TaxID=3154472 RepID=UPI0033B20092